MRQYGSEEAKNLQLDEAYGQMFNHLDYPETGILRTTEIVAAEEGHSYQHAKVLQHQSSWNSNSAW